MDDKTKQEIIERLKILEQYHGLHKNVLKEFQNEGIIYYSEDVGSIFKGILYWVSNKKEYKDHIKEIEDLYDIKVYHCILKHYTFGDILSMLYVGPDEDEWEQEREDLKSGLPIVYADNLSDEFMSEFGHSKIYGVNGGLDIK